MHIFTTLITFVVSDSSMYVSYMSVDNFLHRLEFVWWPLQCCSEWSRFQHAVPPLSPAPYTFLTLRENTTLSPAGHRKTIPWTPNPSTALIPNAVYRLLPQLLEESFEIILRKLDH